MQMLIVARKKDKQEIHVASVASALEKIFPKPVDATTPIEEVVKTPKLCTISEEEVEFSNMMREVDITRSPITEELMDCLYCPHSPQKSQVIVDVANIANSNEQSG